MKNPFERIAEMEAKLNQISAELESQGFHKKWFPGEEISLERAVQDWERMGYEVKRFPSEEEHFARDVDCRYGADPPRTPAYVRKISHKAQ